MTFKIDELGGHAFYKNEMSGWRPGWWFKSERGLSNGQCFGPWATPDAALEWGPAHAACYGVKVATVIDESKTESI